MGKKKHKHSKMARMPTMNVVRTAVRNSGYSESGASFRKGSLAAWHPVKSSPQSDIDANLGVLRGRSSDLVLGTPVASAAINTSRTNIIGAGLNVAPRPMYKLLGITAEQAEAWSRSVKAEFNLWASSTECDVFGRNNFYDMQDIAYMGYAVDGDSFALFKYRKSGPLMPYSLRIQLVEAARISNPWAINTDGIVLPGNVVMHNTDNGNRIINGVEVDDDGKVVAYYVANRYQYDPANMYRAMAWARVTVRSAQTGVPNILQVCHDERAEQYRGVPKLAPVIETIKQTGRYTNAELTAAIIKAYFTMFIKETSDHEIGDMPIADLMNGSGRPSPALDPGSIAIGPGTVNMLPQGYDIATVDPQRSLSTFEPFVKELTKQIGASLGIPYEVLMKSFNSSYTASRAALLQAWSEFKMRRVWFSRDFCQPVYEAWLTEAIVIGRVRAPGFFDDPIKRAAWCNSEWFGPVMGVLDPVKEAQSAQLRILFGLSTREKEAAEMTGTSWDENVERLAIENSRLNQHQLPTYPAVNGNDTTSADDTTEQANTGQEMQSGRREV